MPSLRANRASCGRFASASPTTLTSEPAGEYLPTRASPSWITVHNQPAYSVNSLHTTNGTNAHTNGQGEVHTRIGGDAARGGGDLRRHLFPGDEENHPAPDHAGVVAKRS